MSDFYSPWPKQIAFHSTPAKHRLQIGGFGSAKSKALLMEAVAMCLNFPGINAIILRKTMPDLKRTVIDKFESDVPKYVYERGSQEKGTFNKSDHIVYFPPVLVIDYDPATLKAKINPTSREPLLVWRQSKLYFAACETERDIGKYLSTEFAFVGFEELGEFPYIIYDAMEGRNRTPIPGCIPKMASATNPMGIGWSWIKKVFIEKLPFQGMDPEMYDASDYAFIHSTIEDNPILWRDKKYVQSLEKSPLRQKIRWGKLDSTTGQYFDNWDPSRHVRPADDFIFEYWQPVWVGWDYGFGHFACIIFFTKAILKPRIPDGIGGFLDKPKIVNVAIRELALEQKTPEDQAQALTLSIPRSFDVEGNDMGYKEQIDSIHFSWERFNRTTSNRTVADEVGDLLSGAGLPRPQRSNTDRVAGWTKIYSMLDRDEFFVLRSDGVNRGCPLLAEAIPLLVRGDGIVTDIEDVVKPKGVSLVDDLGDAMRYGVAGVLLDAADKPKDVKLREKLAAIKDPMARHVFAYKEWVKENRPKSGPTVAPSVPSWVNKVRPQR
jgi:hypothetical protein